MGVGTCIISNALGPCPFPREHLLSRDEYPLFSANCIKSPVGSDPGVNMRIRGVSEEDSLKNLSISKGGG